MSAAARTCPTGPAGAAVDGGNLARDGFAVVRGLLAEPAGVLAGQVAAVLERHGWAAPGAGLAPARRGWNTLAPGAADRAAFREICSLEALHRLGHDPGLVAAAAAALGDDDVFRHPRPVARVVAPAASTDQPPTPAHQDQVNMQGARRAVVAWVALTPCPRRAGALQLARGSHRGGPRPHAPAPGSGVLTCPVDSTDQWHSEDLAPGDVILFDALCVHRALPNESAAFRVSVDVRFQLRRDPVCELTLGAYGDLGWDEIYAGWAARPAGDPAGPYYWRRMGLATVPYDPAYASTPLPPGPRRGGPGPSRRGAGTWTVFGAGDGN